MRNAGLEEAQAGIKIARSINNLNYAEDTTLMVESEEKIKSFTVAIVSPSICYEVVGPDAMILVF